VPVVISGTYVPASICQRFATKKLERSIESDVSAQPTYRLCRFHNYESFTIVCTQKESLKTYILEIYCNAQNSNPNKAMPRKPFILAGYEPGSSLLHSAANFFLYLFGLELQT
jgi:hypothetical protein